MKFKNFLKDKATSIGVYDKTKISLFGRANPKTINSADCFGPGLSKFIDVQTDFLGAVALTGVEHTTSNGRKFLLGSITTGVASIALYNVNFQTGETTTVGRILITLPNAAATTHTPRFIRVLDSGTDWKIIIGTVGSVAINGGVFVVNKVNLSDFSFAPYQFFTAQGDDQKGVYFYQDPTAIGVSHVMTTLMGAGYDSTSGQLIAAKGTAAILSHDGFNMSLAPLFPTFTNTAPVTNSGATTFFQSGHALQNNDPVIITANAPAGFTASLPGALQTVYFARNVVAGVSFQLSATSGGAAILGTTITTPSWGRAFGISTNAYLASRKTGSITTGFVNNVLLNNNLQVITPADGVNAGVKCFFLPTVSNFYCYPLTSITAGATSLSGVLGINNTGTGIDYVAPSNVNARYSEVLGKIVYTTAAFGFFLKNWANSQITHAFGTQINTWLENVGNHHDYFRGFVVTGIEVEAGWIFASVNTVGQRGVFMIDAFSEHSFGNTYLISPVTKLGGPSKAQFITTLEELFDVTDTVQLQIKTAATSSDSIFDNPATGWTSIGLAEDLSTLALLNYVQIKLTWDILTFLSGIPAQIVDVSLGYDLLSEMSPYWAGFVDGSTNTNPSYTVYRQIELYDSAPSVLYHRGIDDSGNVVEFFNTTGHPSQFSHSTDEGITWTPGIGPNQIGKRLRFARANPAGVILTNSLKES